MNCADIASSTQLEEKSQVQILKNCFSLEEQATLYKIHCFKSRMNYRVAERLLDSVTMLHLNSCL